MMTLSSLVSSRALLNLLLKRYFGRFCGLLISILLSSATVLAFGYGVRFTIDHWNGDTSLIQTLSLLIVGSLTLAISSFGRIYFSHSLDAHCVTYLRKEIFHHLLSVPYFCLQNIAKSTVMNSFTLDMEALSHFLNKSLAVALRNLVLCLGGLLMMGILSPMLTLWVVGGLPLLFFWNRIFIRKLKHVLEKTRSSYDNMQAFLDETFSNIHTLYTFHHQEADKETFDTLSDKNLQHASYLSRAIVAFSFVFSIMIGFVAIFFAGYESVLREEFSLGSWYAFMMYAALFCASSASFGELAGDFQKTYKALDHALDFFRLPCETSSSKKRFVTSLRGIVAFHGVSFSYPNLDYLVTNKVTFSVAPGEMLAIVGPTGAGKSTLFQLLLGLYTPQKGHIYVDGIDLRDLSSQEIRACMALVPQDPTLFSMTLRDNIRYSSPHATQQEVFRAAEQAHVVEFLSSLPHGMDTILGPQGMTLSAGQKQRVAIARALLKDPKILLLDEATSALDSESEAHIQESLKSLRSTRTILTIAHRLSTVLHANHTLVLNKGVVQDIGTHGELIGKNRLYQRLATLQFLDTSFS